MTFSRIVKRMDVHFTAETENKLKELAAQSESGTADELVRNVIEGYLDELAETRDMLTGRYDSLKTNVLKPIAGEEIVAHFRKKSTAARRPVSGS
jgi:predicted DNA-binding protein